MIYIWQTKRGSDPYENFGIEQKIKTKIEFQKNVMKLLTSAFLGAAIADPVL